MEKEVGTKDAAEAIRAFNVALKALLWDLSKARAEVVENLDAFRY